MPAAAASPAGAACSLASLPTPAAAFAFAEDSYFAELASAGIAAAAAAAAEVVVLLMKLCAAALLLLLHGHLLCHTYPAVSH